MKINKFILKSFGIITTAITFSVVGVHKTTAQKTDKPNVLFILADDFGNHDLSSTGSRFYETPNIDKIASEGVSFTHGYTTSPVCSPARASLMTGQFPARHGITDWIGARTGKEWRKAGRHSKLLPPDYKHKLSSESITLAEAMKEAGYKTFFAGKWHIGSKGSWPEDRGFDINIGGWDRGSPIGGYFDPYNNPNLKNRKPGENLSMRLADETVQFLNENNPRETGQPVFAYLSFYAVHSPIQTTQEKWKKYRDKAEDLGIAKTGFEMGDYDPIRTVQDNPIYAGLVEAMDDAVGYVLDNLEKLGLDDNTIVIFTSDHGGVSSGDVYATSNLPLRKGKGSTFEGGLRVPYFIKVPNLTENLPDCDVPVTGADFYPTILELIGADLKPEEHADGVSLVPLLYGEKIENRFLTWHYPHYGNQGGRPSSVIREGDWKLIHLYESGQDELYNLNTDINEAKNLIQQYPDKVKALKNKLFSYLNKVGAKYPEHDPQYDAEAEMKYLETIKNKNMPGLERQRLEFLSENYNPGNNWWGSFVDLQADRDFNVQKKLKNASVVFEDSKLIVSTGEVRRTWLWTGTGFQTVSFKNLKSGKEWCGVESIYASDWNLPERIDNHSKGELISVECLETDDQKFTSNHLLFSALVRYNFGLDVKFLVRVYPGAPGIWTALEVRGNESFSPEGIPEDIATFKYYGSNQPVKIARSEFIPVDFSVENKRRYWGFYNDPGNRVNTRDMVKEKIIDGFPLFRDEQNTWASGLSVESGSEGLIIVKESNKTVNKYGHQTGSFFCNPNGVEVTGWGLKPGEIGPEFKRTWPAWTILFSGGDDMMQLALKQFDRIRYPIDPDRDMHILIDTWGSDWQNEDYDKIYGRENSAFPVVEREIKSAADLGIDIVRIDDGWQEGRTRSKNSWHPNPGVGYDPHWAKTKKLSEEYDVRIGLWAAVRDISLEELIKNQEELNVATWKFDFDKLEDHDAFANRLEGIRTFIQKTGYSTQTSWCPEYDDQRYGWYSAVRECGPMYFQNIQNNMPEHLAYVPYITLRHHWMMSKFYNMNDLQCHWQNPARTNPKLSDAYLHSQTYAALSSFMAAPSCFMLTQLLKPGERDELREIISIYKNHRKAIFDSFVFPIGQEPNNASWTGFQICRPGKDSGYLMVFRELHNKQKTGNLDLRFLKDQTILLTDLETDKTKIIKLNGNTLTVEIEHPPGCKFLKYQVLNE